MNVEIRSRRRDEVERVDLWKDVAHAICTDGGDIMVADSQGEMIYNRDDYTYLRMIGTDND